MTVILSVALCLGIMASCAFGKDNVSSEAAERTNADSENLPDS